MSKSLFSIALLAASLAVAAEAAYASGFQRQVAADPRGEVDISNVNGSIVVTGWDRSIVAVTTDLPSDTERVKVIGGRSRTRVCVTYGNSNSCDSRGWSSGDGGSVRLEVHVPRDSELDVSGVNAGITSRGVAGAQRLHTVNGDIDAQLGSGDNEVSSVSGTVNLHGTGQDGTLHVSSVSGDLGVTNVAGELEARAVNGNLRIQLSSARLVHLNTTSGNILLNTRLTSGATVEAETVSGDEKLEVSAPAGYSYEAKSFSGDIEDCFGQQPDRNEYGPGSRLNGTHGAGNGHVRIRSLSGSISLCDH